MFMATEQVARPRPQARRPQARLVALTQPRSDTCISINQPDSDNVVQVRIIIFGPGKRQYMHVHGHLHLMYMYMYMYGLYLRG